MFMARHFGKKHVSIDDGYECVTYSFRGQMYVWKFNKI